MEAQSLTGGNILLQLVPQEGVDQLLARLQVVLQLLLLLLQNHPVLRGLLQHSCVSLLHLLLTAGQLLLGLLELLSAASLDTLVKRVELDSLSQERIVVYEPLSPF